MSIRDRFKIFDFFTGVYGTQKMVDRYSGPIIRIRRDSDNAEKDFITLNGVGSHVDINEILDFVGTGGTDNGYVTMLYDQHENRSKITTYKASLSDVEPNGTNFYQSSSSAQPSIVKNGVIVVDSSGNPAMEFDPYSDSTNLKMGRQTRLVDNMIIGTLSEFRSIAASAKTINMMFTSSKTRIIYNNVRQAVINNEARPDRVVGTDTNYYQVKLQGDTVSDNKPTTGLNYLTYWETQPVGNSTHDPIDYAAVSQFYTYEKEMPQTMQDTASALNPVRLFQYYTINYGNPNMTHTIFENAYRRKLKTSNNFGLTGYSFSNVTHRSDESSTEFSTSQVSKIGQRCDLVSSAFIGYKDDPLSSFMNQGFSQDLISVLGYGV